MAIDPNTLVRDSLNDFFSFALMVLLSYFIECNIVYLDCCNEARYFTYIIVRLISFKGFAFKSLVFVSDLIFLMNLIFCLLTFYKRTNGILLLFHLSN